MALLSAGIFTVESRPSGSRGLSHGAATSATAEQITAPVDAVIHFPSALAASQRASYNGEHCWIIVTVFGKTIVSQRCHLDYIIVHYATNKFTLNLHAKPDLQHDTMTS